MTYAPTVRYLEAAALKAGAASFWFGAQASQDINYNAAFPQALLFLLPAPVIGENVAYQVVLQFVGKDEHENAYNLAAPLADGQALTPQAAATAAGQSLAIQDAMDVLSQDFIALLRDEDSPFDVSERIDRGPVLRKGAGIGTGFVLSFTLTARALC